MEHFNYSRQLVKHCVSMQETATFDPSARMLLSSVVDLHRTSTKFILPDGGRLYEDKSYRALDESVPLRLPYPCTCLEYRSNGKERAEDEPIGFMNGIPQYEQTDFVRAPKRVVYASERGDYIVVTVAFWTRHDDSWRILPECAIPTTGYLNRGVAFAERPAIMVKFQDERVPMSDYMDEIGALLCFLNVLQCSNVHIERSDPKKSGKNIKAALPFDSYHILTIAPYGKTGEGLPANGHRSPREHLRRGHIRRLEDGRRIFVSATVVGAGRGYGVVRKEYVMRTV